MAMVITPESELGRELAKWNKTYQFAPFPRMLYRARRRDDGVVSVVENDDRLFGGVPGAAEVWSSANQRTVGNESELQAALEQGWRNSPLEAMERFEAKEHAIGEAAAIRNYEDRNMSERAKAEAAAVEAQSFEHVPEIPVAPVKRRGRPPKQAVA
jgi:hypothetical protein